MSSNKITTLGMNRKFKDVAIYMFISDKFRVRDRYKTETMVWSIFRDQDGPRLDNPSFRDPDETETYYLETETRIFLPLVGRFETRPRRESRLTLLKLQLPFI